MIGAGRIPRGVKAPALWVLVAVHGMTFAAACGEQRPSVHVGRPATIVSTTGGHREASNAVGMQDGFALDLYRRLGGAPADGNLFFSPYSVYAVLAMTAEGARGETADEIGRALHLPAALRQQGPGAEARPWNFAPVHAGIGRMEAELERGAGSVAGVEPRIDFVRRALAEADDSLRHAIEHHDWKAAQAQRNLAQPLAAELNILLPQANRYEIRVAHALWSDARYAFASEFVRTVAAHYGTHVVRTVDYRRNAERARVQINAWVAEHTAQRIRDLLPSGSVIRSTRLVLADAIWFKGDWVEPFDSSRTQQAPFRLARGRTTRVPLMNRLLIGARYAAFRADGSMFPTPREIGYDAPSDPADPKLYPGVGGFQLAELPYKGATLSMVILLPYSPDGLEVIERRLDAKRLTAWIGGLEPRPTNVFLPRFRLEQGRDLRTPLEAMGMVRAFADPATGLGAQFDGMTASTNPDDAVFVGAVWQKAFLEVNEKGTEAAAATVGMLVGSSQGKPKRTGPFVPMFRADRPFLFLIRERSSGAILFMGRLQQP